jgi:hypothetical protein
MKSGVTGLSELAVRIWLIRLVTLHLSAFVGGDVGEKACATCPSLLELLHRSLDHGGRRRWSIDSVQNVLQRPTCRSTAPFSFQQSRKRIKRLLAHEHGRLQNHRTVRQASGEITLGVGPGNFRERDSATIVWLDQHVVHARTVAGSCPLVYLGLNPHRNKHSGGVCILKI